MAVVDAEHLEASFGPSVRLVRATIEVTGEPVTRGIERYLPWFDQIGGRMLKGQSSSATNAPAAHIHAGWFRMAR